MVRTLKRAILSTAAPLVAVAFVTAASLQPARADEVFTIGGTFTVVGGNTPDSFSQTVAFAPGTVSLGSSGLSLTISIVPVGDAAHSEWVVFDYRSTNGSPISSPGESWNISQNGLPAAVPGNFVGDFTQFLNSDGIAFDQTNGIFGQTLMSNPVPGGTGNGEGTLGFTSPFPVGPVYDLGAFSSPFAIVTNALGTTDVYGFVQALEFAPQTPVDETPEPVTITLFAAGLAGLGVVRRRKALTA